MSQKNRIVGWLLFFLAMAFTPLAAQTVDPARASVFKVSLIAGGAVIALAVIAGAFGQSKAISSACESISRNPAAGQNIRGILIFGLVLIETLVIYALLITIIILMVKWGAY
ncbi:MAG TPA: hypothetical protein ENO29_09685 [Candidatus Aminicenantes bacterium]|nr:MAG: hypothetical protein C0168_00455 [Candidatus Aminicenantes bacterium]HEK86607.1 hypothetical protein [Candidatus Aminicenantes bacterium]